MATDKASGLERDFGYLMPFFDKVAAAAASVQNPSAREELLGLLAGERAKWERIRALLGGAPGQASNGPASTRDLAPPPPARAGAEPEAARTQFTVGPLNRS